MSQLTSWQTPFQVHWGVDGRHHRESEMLTKIESLRSRWVLGRHLSRPEIACYLSHKDLWEKAASSNCEWTLILEDDTTFNYNPSEFLENLKNEKCPTVILLKHCLCSTICSSSAYTVIKNLKAYECNGTYAYLINKAAAISAIKLHRRYGILSMPDFPHYWTNKINFHSVCGLVQTDTSSSNVTVERDKKRKSKTQLRMSLIATLTGSRMITGLFLGIPIHVILIVEKLRIKYLKNQFAAKLTTRSR